ncbi:Nidogen-1 [Trichinella pseudospiralis]|uniref:Nidogen-1 n=1 Tax=Trichinella pseudospiralis TaxID=6337 RepID=A0A0V0XJZ8_TRIPS|nr:Nidogen-1 [Trichinella pseudospiralis]
MFFVCYCFCAILFAQIGAVPKQNFYPFGRHHGDHSLAPNDDQSSDELQLLDSIHFYGKVYRSVYINENGMISFDTDFNSYRTGELTDFGHPLIAIFYADVDISGPHGGHVFYRQFYQILRTSQNPELLKTSSDLIRNKFHWDASDYEAKSLLIVTWDRVGSYQRHNDRINSFQLVISSNETTSYAQFLYADDEIQWIKSTDKYPHGSNQIARAAFVDAENNIYALPESYSKRMFDINKETNVALPGVFLYRISESTIVSPQDDDEEADDYYPYDPSEYEDGEPLEYTENNEEQKLEEESDEIEQAGLMCPDNFHGDSCPENCHLIQEKYCQRCHCPQDVEDHTSTPPTGSRGSYPKSVDHCLYAGPHACHANAECVNYQDGFCCRCKVGFIGNGVDCLSENEAQRISGRVSGRLNDVDIVDSELHTYAVLEDGRTYTAISRIPEKIGTSMLFLNTLGSIMGWLFSKPTNQSVENGFTMTGGRLNRTVTVHVADQHTVTIQQDFSGQDNHGYLKTNVFIAGTVPHLPTSTTVDFGEHYEEFSRQRYFSGVVKSYSNLLVTAGNERYSVIVDQTIRFDQSCPFLHVQTGRRSLLKQERSYVVYETAEQMVRYAAGNSLEPPGYQRENPCQEGAHDCTGPHVVCVPENQRYRCACEDGYQMQYGRENSLVCIGENDFKFATSYLDECSHGMHRCDINANCINMEGGYSCQCLPGFYGDGYQCSEQLICGMKICNTNADCLLDHATRLPRCVCRPGFVGDGVSCTLIGKEMMTVDLRLPGQQPSSNPCDQVRCHDQAECIVDKNQVARCYCKSGYQGDGYSSCEIVSYETGSQDNDCEKLQCGTNAQCSLDQNGIARCFCIHGFEGDGYYCKPITCERVQCSADAECHYNTNGVAECVCKDGYEGDGFQCQRKLQTTATYPKECLQFICGKNAECRLNHQGNPGCYCKEGFERDGVHCKQVSLDSRTPTFSCENIRCGQNAQCYRDYTGVANCYCNPGYEGDGYQCRPVEAEQRDQCDQIHCGPNAFCKIDLVTSQPTCHCESGYQRDGDICKLVEDRQEQPGNLCRSHQDCSEHGQCTYNDAIEAYQCQCRPPYSGDGIHCFLEAETCEHTRNCHPDADCVFEQHETGGGYRCRCRKGFSGNGYQCQPLESVAAAEIQCNVLNTCHPNAQCVFDSNSRRYVCQCQQGFTGDGYNCQETSRSEEKAMHPCQSADDCHVNAHCVNVPSSPDQYLCECLPGFRGDGLNICEPADECNPGAQPTGCAEQAACLYDNNEQAYKCRCLQGYAGDGKICTLERTQDCSFDPSLCHRDAECLFEHERSMHVCQCRPGFLGDGYYSCQLQSSESCVVQNLCDPQARCVPNERGTDFHCVCNAGYEGDGFTCNRITGTAFYITLNNDFNNFVVLVHKDCSRDTNICDENAVCVSENLRHVCRCKAGYHGSGFICSSDSRVRGRALVFSQGMSLVQRGLLPDDYGKQLIVVPFQIAVGVDYDCQEDKIYWTDVSGHSVHSSNLDGSNVTTLFDTDIVSPEGIVIDSLNRNLYYTDSIRDEIVVSSLRGNHRVAIIKDGLVNPRALALDPIDRKLYYSDWHREKPVIGRLNLDGTARELFVTSNIALPNGLVVLNRRRELCWADAGTQRLECIGLNGGGRHVIFAPLGYPFGLTAHNEETFYWTDWEDKRIHSVNIYGQDHHSMEAAVGASGKLYGIVAIPTQCFPGESPCMFNNGGCRYVCTPDHRGARRCLCPNDVSEVECNQVFR